MARIGYTLSSEEHAPNTRLRTRASLKRLVLPLRRFPTTFIRGSIVRVTARLCGRCWVESHRRPNGWS